jgi:hypothetical protein
MSHPIQIILTRQLAGYLSVPTFLVDPNGTLLFYNEPAEVLLGCGSTRLARCRRKNSQRFLLL